MFSSLLTAASMLAFGVSQVVGQDCYYCNRSAPFNLVIESSNSTLNGQTLKSCHTGAAIESLCLISGTGSNYYFNTSSSTGSPTSPKLGYLTWTLQGSNFNVSEPLTFSINPASNVALPLLEPGTTNAQLLTFTTNSTGPCQTCQDGPGGYLALASNLDDTVVPAAYTNAALLERWYICQTYFTGYRYTTLAWTLGKAAPQNPTCQKVRVKRVFV